MFLLKAPNSSSISIGPRRKYFIIFYGMISSLYDPIWWWLENIVLSQILVVFMRIHKP